MLTLDSLRLAVKLVRQWRSSSRAKALAFTASTGLARFSSPYPFGL